MIGTPFRGNGEDVKEDNGLVNVISPLLLTCNSYAGRIFIAMSILKSVSVCLNYTYNLFRSIQLRGIVNRWLDLPVVALLD